MKRIIAMISAVAIAVSAGSLPEVEADVVDDVEAVVTAELAEDGLSLDLLDIDNEAIAIEASLEIEGSSDYIDYEIDYELSDSEAIVELESSVDEIDETTIAVDVLEGNEEYVRFMAENVETGESVVFDTREGTLDAVPIVIAIPAIGAILDALFKAAAVLVIAGVTYVLASKAVPKIYEQLKKNRRTAVHYQAYRSSKGLYFGSGLTLNEAINRGRSGGDVWSTTKGGARSVAAGVKRKTPVGPEKDRGGVDKFCHYHPANRSPNMHAFYGTAGGRC